MTNVPVEKYKDLIAEAVGGDRAVADMLIFETSRNEAVSAPGRHPFLFHGLLAVLTNVLYPLFGLKRRVRMSDEDFVFVSCPDPIFRTRTIGLIAGDLKFGIIYLPNFHVLAALRYHRYFKDKGINAFFPTIRLRDVFQARKMAAAFRSQCGIRGSEETTRKLVSVLSSYMIYDGVVKEFLSQAGSFHGKWILEHDKFYFMSTVANLHQRGERCTMLQHGCFMEIDTDFMPLFCDKVLCCSERERKTYISCGLDPDQVAVLGAPLQTIRMDDRVDIRDRKHHELLILLTLASEESLPSMKAVLHFVKNNYDSVLVRMRPRSMKNDMKYLQEELTGMEVSDNKNTLSEDIASCSKVISFSEDANIEVTKFNKPFIYVHSWLGEGRNRRRDMPYATIENYEEEIRKLMEQDFYSSFTKEQYEEIVGETRVEVLRQRFFDYIKS